LWVKFATFYYYDDSLSKPTFLGECRNSLKLKWWYLGFTGEWALDVTAGDSDRFIFYFAVLERFAAYCGDSMKK
jgi:hypothetical protein